MRAYSNCNISTKSTKQTTECFRELYSFIMTQRRCRFYQCLKCRTSAFLLFQIWLSHTRATRHLPTDWSTLRKWWVSQRNLSLHLRGSFKRDVLNVSVCVFQRMIANTVRIMRYCRSQPFSKTTVWTSYQNHVSVQLILMHFSLLLSLFGIYRSRSATGDR